MVITDVRYPNECRWIRGLGGKVVFLNRPGVVPANEEEAGSIQAAVCANLIDLVVSNDETPAVLGRRVLDLVAETSA